MPTLHGATNICATASCQVLSCSWEFFFSDTGLVFVTIELLQKDWQRFWHLRLGVGVQYVRVRISRKLGAWLPEAWHTSVRVRRT